MASSSSSSYSVPASISQSWNYDVFLSFRGEDTRKSFVDHLYMALEQQGIHTYKDDETLACGVRIGPTLLKAIQDSRIAVIVISKIYADSSWCLDEVAHIMECMDTRGQIVEPVFYHVDPSDFRKQKGKYKEAFTKHEMENKQKVESWRKALEKAGNLSGWVINNIENSREAKCIRDIVSTISSRLSLLVTNDYKDLIGMETRLRNLKSVLEIGSGGVRMVGIWGHGGGGKTTLACAAYAEISHQFEACCLLENIREESSKHGLTKLQENFPSLVLKTNDVVGSEIEGRSMIKRRLCLKRVSAVLDDVDNLEQLEALAGSHDWFGEGSRIIITTRDKHMLSSRAHTNIYEVSLLSHYEAIKLFNRHACHKDKHDEEYEMLAEEVVSYAGGLPLALKVLGSFLYDKDKDEWKSTLAKLKCIPEDKVMERLKISYDGLEPYQKDLFLDVACFMRRWNSWEMDRAMMVLDACNFHPVIGLKVLEQKSLIKVSKEEGFEMHDLIEEMAHYIVRGEHPKNPEKHSRIWKKEDLLEICAMELGTFMENEVLVLQKPLRDDDTFAFSPLTIPGVVANMKKLRWINWDRYPASSSPSNFQPRKLACLVLTRGNQKQLWQGCKHLPNLKILDLNKSSLLIRTLDFNGLPCLESLMLQECGRLKEIHPSIGYHERLVFVNMKECSKLKVFPPIIRMRKLETLDLSYCSRLQKFPDIQTNMDGLVKLYLKGTDIKIVPPSVGHFCTNLVSLDLSHCQKLKRIEGNFRLLKRLKHLHLKYSRQLENLAGDFFDKECCLEVLSLAIKSQELTSFMNRMTCFRLPFFHQDRLVSLGLPQFPRFLRKLSLSDCNLGDGDIPYDICELVNLQELDLSGNNFSRLNSSLLGIRCLKLLKLSFCESLEELPYLPSSIAILIAEHCYSLESIGYISNYKWLWKVSLERPNKLIGGERVLRSMLEVYPLLLNFNLFMVTTYNNSNNNNDSNVETDPWQVNAVEDRFTTVKLPQEWPSKCLIDYIKSITLQLPHNWYSNFSGFLLYSNKCMLWQCRISIMKEMSMDSQPHRDHWEEFDKKLKLNGCGQVAYVPFGALRHTSWWNTTYTKISFEIEGVANPRVGLVPRKCKSGDLREKERRSERWEGDDEDRKTFVIHDNLICSKVEIDWNI